MAAETMNYQLKKPSQEDFYDIDVMNDNTDVIDRELKLHQDQLDLLKRDYTVTLLASKWSSTAPFTQTVTVPGITASSNPILMKGLSGSENEAAVKAYYKAFGFLFAGETGNGIISVKAYKKPAIDFTIMLKGV